MNFTYASPGWTISVVAYHVYIVDIQGDGPLITDNKVILDLWNSSIFKFIFNLNLIENSLLLREHELNMKSF